MLSTTNATNATSNLATATNAASSTQLNYCSAISVETALKKTATDATTKFTDEIIKLSTRLGVAPQEAQIRASADLAASQAREYAVTMAGYAGTPSTISIDGQPAIYAGPTKGWVSAATYTSMGLKYYQEGGYVPKTGLAMLHAGEYVTPRENVGAGGGTVNNNFYIDAGEDLKDYIQECVEDYYRSHIYRRAI
jgi:hypothetical protein